MTPETEKVFEWCKGKVYFTYLVAIQGQARTRSVCLRIGQRSWMLVGLVFPTFNYLRFSDPPASEPIQQDSDTQQTWKFGE